MSISPLGIPSAPIQAEPPAGTRPEEETTAGFAELLKKAASKVNAQHFAADGLTQRLAAGESLDIAQTMLAITKVDLSLRLLVQVRNKALTAYEEIMRMQL